MVILISGATHTGKTKLAQKLLVRHKFTYLSIDHLKMGLIKSGYTKLTTEDSIEKLTKYLWPVIVGIIKTNIENNQNIIIEGCYIPFDYQKYFNDDYLSHIQYKCIIFSEAYCRKNYADIIKNASNIETRDGQVSLEMILYENHYYLENCKAYNCDYLLIKDKYQVDFLI